MKEPRIFHHWPGDHTKCPLCTGHEDKPCILVPIVGTEGDGVVQCQPVHVACILNNVRLVGDDRIGVLIAAAAPLDPPIRDFRQGEQGKPLIIE